MLSFQSVASSREYESHLYHIIKMVAKLHECRSKKKKNNNCLANAQAANAASGDMHFNLCVEERRRKVCMSLCMCVCLNLVYRGTHLHFAASVLPAVYSLMKHISPT